MDDGYSVAMPAPRSATTMILRRYAPLGRCMYCLATGVALSEEHLIPKSLGGRLTLRDSVCEPCRIRTGRLEQATLDRDFAIPKTLLALKRRRARKPGPKRLPRLAGGARLANGLDEAADADGDPARWPRDFWLPVFERSGLLAGVDRPIPAVPAGFAAGRLQLGTMRAPLAPPAPVLADPFAFGWSLAKWAYAFAVAERGLDACDTQPIRQLMNGERRDVFNFVGNPDPVETVEADRRVLHAPRLREHAGWLTVALGILGSAGVPPYEIVVGALAST